MKYYIKQHPFSLKGKFDIFNQFEETIYRCEGEFSLKKKLHLYDKLDNELAYITAKVWSIHSRHYIERKGKETVEVYKAFAIKPHYFIDSLGWEITGNFWEHDYTIKKGNEIIATVKKEWFKLADFYEIDVADGVDEIYVLSAVLVIDSVVSTEAVAASSAGGAS